MNSHTMQKSFPMKEILLALLAVTWGTVPAGATHLGWDQLPTVFNTPFGAAGPNGIPGDFDDPVPQLGEVFFAGIRSGYSGGLYTRHASERGIPGETGGQLTADADLRSEVFRISATEFRYVWTLTNSGSGDLVDYGDTNGASLPEFITVVNNLGFPELDGTAGATADLTTAPSSEVQTMVGGPPRIILWGGTWNPSVEPEAQSLVPTPVPEPNPWIPLGTLLFIGALSRCKARIRNAL